MLNVGDTPHPPMQDLSCLDCRSRRHSHWLDQGVYSSYEPHPRSRHLIGGGNTRSPPAGHRSPRSGVPSSRAIPPPEPIFQPLRLNPSLREDKPQPSLSALWLIVPFPSLKADDIGGLDSSDELARAQPWFHTAHR